MNSNKQFNPYFIVSVVCCLTLSSTFSLTALANSEVTEAKLPSQATKLPVETTKLPMQPTRIMVDQTNPYNMIKGAAELTFARFATERDAIKANPNLLKDIVREELMPYINYKYSAFKVVGKHLRSTTDEERRDFVPVFKEYLVSSYAQVFTLYDNQRVEFEPAQPLGEERIIAVNTRIIMPGRDNIDVAFKVRRDKDTNQWQAFDMVAEGVSLLDSKQAELGGIIRQKGLAYVTELLKSKSDRDIVFKGGNANNEEVANEKKTKAN